MLGARPTTTAIGTMLGSRVGDGTTALITLAKLVGGGPRLVLRPRAISAPRSRFGTVEIAVEL